MAKPKRTDDVLKELRAFGLGYPGAHYKSPWPGHMDLAVKDKTFAYLSLEGEPFHIGCKLPRSSSLALMLPFCTPTAYGLGKSGWVSAAPAADEIDIDMFKAWLDESYRAQAPKKLVAQIGAAGAALPATKKSAAKPPIAKPPGAKASAAKKPAAKLPAAKRRAKPAAAARRARR